MKFIPLRSAVIAGTCAVALSFVSLPAFASTAGIDAGGDPTVSQVDPAVTDAPSEDPAAEPTDEATDPTTDGTDQTTDESDQTTDGTDQTTDESDETADESSEPVESEPSDDDATPAPVETETPAAPLPAEKGDPKQVFQQTVFLPKGIARNGLHVKYTGLTPKATYQPFYNGGQSGGGLGNAKRANANGAINFVYHFTKSEKWATTLGSTYNIGLLGLDTDLRLEQQIEVKYDSDVTLTTDRHGKKVHLTASVDKAGKSGKDTAWKKVAVHFQKKTGTKWVTVKTVKTDAKGLAQASIKSGKTLWRAVVASGRTVAGTTTKGHKK